MATPTLPTIRRTPVVLFGNSIVVWYTPGGNTSSMTIVCSGGTGDVTEIVPVQPNAEYSETFSSLTPGQKYSLSIQANNVNGSSAIQNFTPVTVGSLPSEVQNLRHTIVGNNVVLIWDPPANTGFSPIGWYGLQVSSFTARYNTAFYDKSFTFVNSANSNYTYQVCAINDAGWGPRASLYVTVPFDPSMLASSIVSWHDASSIPGVMYTPVSTWSSKIGTKDAVSQTTFTPVLHTNVLNGKNAVYYDSSRWHNMNLGITSGNYTFISVSRLTSTASSARVFGDSANNTLIGYWNGRQNVLYLNNNPSFLNGIASNTNWNLYTLTMNSSLNYSFSNFGSMLYSGFPCSGVLTNLSFNGVVGSSELSFCYIAECLVFSPQLSTTDQQKVEGYLAWKYGLQDSLAANHPYRNQAPTSAN